VSRGAESAYSPREWIGAAPFPWPPVLSSADGEAVVACFSVSSVAVGRTRTNAPFLKLQLADAYGVVDARMWDDVDAVADHLRPGSYIGVRGCMETYQDQRQLRIDQLGILAIELDDLLLFLPRSSRPAEVMDAELDACIDSVGDDALRALLRALLDRDSEIGRAYRLAPAAKQNHHAYLGGLLEHTLSVARVCDMLADHYRGGIDRDLLIAGALLHDIGKIREIGARGGFPYTDEGKLLGHILLGLQMVADAAAAVPELKPARLLLLQHLIASHQGRYEWQSPREPRILEGLLLHYADDLDAKFNQASALVNAVAGGWTAYDRGFARDFLKHAAAEAPPLDAPANGSAAVRTGEPHAAATPAPPQHAAGRGEVGTDEVAMGEAGTGEVGTGDTGDTGDTGEVDRSVGAGEGAGGSAAPDSGAREQRGTAPGEPPGLGTLDLFEEP
jgi:3'-5' exoribonuclease